MILLIKKSLIGLNSTMDNKFSLLQETILEELELSNILKNIQDPLILYILKILTQNLSLPEVETFLSLEKEKIVGFQSKKKKVFIIMLLKKEKEKDLSDL